MNAIIIESGAGARRLDVKESEPRSLHSLNSDHRPLLAWVLHALDVTGVSCPVYIGGYHIEKVIQRFPRLQFRYHDRRREEGELGAFLLSADFADRAMVVARATTVLLPNALTALGTADIVSGTYSDGSHERPAGLYRFSRERLPTVFEVARSIVAAEPWADLDTLMERLAREGYPVHQPSLNGWAAPEEDRPAVVRTIFQGKAQTLENFAPIAQSAVIQRRLRFTVDRWRHAPVDVLDTLRGEFADGSLVVRSSARGEDSLQSSEAGRFHSVLNVDALDSAAVTRAVEAVIASYSSLGRQPDARDEVLIQPQVSRLNVSGVMLTRDPQTGAPYFVINADRKSGRSDSVTAGDADIDTCFVAWSGSAAPTLPADLQPVVSVGRDLMALSHLDALDIEFGVDASGACHVFQVRPLAVAAERLPLADEDVLEVLSYSETFVRERMRPRSGLLGRTTVLGTMPDWNPAEMIGTKPRPLALSLYQSLIGDTSWAKARAAVGYRDVQPEPLILSVGGVPYVDVRVSLNSLLPADLDTSVGEPWVNACLDQLSANPALHDKIEFEVAITCLTPEWDRQAIRMAAAGLDVAQVSHFRDRLRNLTDNILLERVSPILWSERQLQHMADRHSVIAGDGGTGISDHARRLRHLLDDCRRFGVVPFSILARYAFMSLAWLRGFGTAGVLTAAEHDDFLRAVPTVASGFSAALALYADEELTLQELIAEYGHLRPNSYEITSPNYASDPQQYFRGRSVGAQGSDPATDAARILLERRRDISEAMSALGLGADAEHAARFISASISAREIAKFQFMRNVNAALETVAAMGRCLDLSREQLSFVPITDLVRLETDSITQATRSHLRRISEFHEKRWLLTRALRLPDLIRRPEQVQAFEVEEGRANFVTHRTVTAPVVWLDDAAPNTVLDGAIVGIRAADPGFDWLFGHRIVGLITQYGGLGSHMAIRAAEFGLPAAIGCGGPAFDRLRGALVIELDCEHGRIVRLG